ncbi:MAG: permease [Elusimicrobia bacterium]|nr:permease [Elusimicrobiota bacterium]
MFMPTIVMAIFACILLYIGYSRGEGQHITGVKSALGMTVEILPLLIFAFIVASMVQVLLPQELLSKWIGTESGPRGIIIGTVAGGLAPGGPYVSLPIAAGLLRSGAGVGTMVAFLTGWSLWAIARLPMEVGIMGWRFAVIRLASTFFLPPIAGLIAQALFGNVKI